MSNAARLTLTLPEILLIEFKSLVGDRKMSSTIASLMQDWLKEQKKNKFLQKTKEIAQQAEDDQSVLTSLQIINAYKHDRV